MMIKKTLSGFFFRALRSKETYIFLLLTLLLVIPLMIEIRNDPDHFYYGYYNSFFLPAVLVCLYHIYFFSKFFRDETLTNLMLSGHSKKEIFLAAWLFSSCLSFICLLIYSLEAVTAGKIIAPDIKLYFSYSVLLFFLAFLFCLFFITVSLSALFISKNAVISVIVTFIVAVITLSVSVRLITDLMFTEDRFDPAYSAFIKRAIERGSEVEYRIDPDELQEKLYIDGEVPEYEFNADPDALTGYKRELAKTVVLSSPTAFYYLLFIPGNTEEMVSMIKPVSINIAVTVMFIVLIIILSVHIFSRRDI